MEAADVMLVLPTTTESVLNALLELSGVQLPRSASLSVDKTQPTMCRLESASALVDTA